MTKAQVTIRKATPADLEGVCAVFDEIHTAEEAGQLTTGWKREIYPVRGTFEAALERDDLFVAETAAAPSLPEGSACGEAAGSADETEVPAAPRIIGAGILNRIQVDVYEGAPWRCEAPDEEVMVLHTLGIAPSGAGCGAGTAFVKYYEAYAREHGCRELRIDTNETNRAARRLYGKLGYSEIGIVPTVFNGIPGVNLVLLEKTLDAK